MYIASFVHDVYSQHRASIVLIYVFNIGHLRAAKYIAL